MTRSESEEMRALVVATIALAGCGTGEQGIDGGELPFEDGAAASDGTSIDLDALVVSDGGAEAAPMGCMGLPDGTKCQSAPDACHTDGVCVMGQCSPPQVRPDGYNWKQGDEFARCCNGKPIITNTNSDCGVCGIQCNQNNGESCQLLGGRWFCRGCNTSAGCWSKCCSLSFNPPSCAASDCMGNCSSQYCPKGTTCKLGMGISSNYCAYP